MSAPAKAGAPSLEERASAIRVRKVEEPAPSEPAPGTWAATARMMAEEFPDFDWDSWKDQMKEGDLP